MAVEVNFTCDRCGSRGAEVPGPEGTDRMPRGWERLPDPRVKQQTDKIGDRRQIGLDGPETDDRLITGAAAPAVFNARGYRQYSVHSVGNDPAPVRRLDLCDHCAVVVREMIRIGHETYAKFINASFKDLDWVPPRLMSDQEMRVRQRKKTADGF